MSGRRQIRIGLAVTGLMLGLTTGCLHTDPYTGPNNLGRIAPAVAGALRPLIAGAGGFGFRGGFQRGLLG